MPLRSPRAAVACRGLGGGPPAAAAHTEPALPVLHRGGLRQRLPTRGASDPLLCHFHRWNAECGFSNICKKCPFCHILFLAVCKNSWHAVPRVVRSLRGWYNLFAAMVAVAIPVAAAVVGGCGRVVIRERFPTSPGCKRCGTSWWLRWTAGTSSWSTTTSCMRTGSFLAPAWRCVVGLLRVVVAADRQACFVKVK